MPIDVHVVVRLCCDPRAERIGVKLAREGTVSMCAFTEPVRTGIGAV